MEQSASGGHCDPEKMFDVILKKTKLVWIFIPYYVRIIYDVYLDICSTLAEFENTPNTAYLHKEHISFFLGNAFSIDVDDNHRVVSFRDIGPTQSLLPSYLTIKGHDCFLREDFRLLLRVNIVDCDIRKQYLNGVIFEMMREFSVD
ncbi:hypothetical protein DFS33DRAFT_1381020 [Desarmillaria ectypa]|nr:hypothetical protein DFS33DRAFT_1381020 [Desarmillaria ectypa]